MLSIPSRLVSKIKIVRKFIPRPRRLLIIAAVLTIVVTKFFYSNPSGSKFLSSKEVPNWEEVPEMEEVLSDEQEVRLTAMRKMVERVGVDTALEIVESSPLPHDGEGHLAVHQIGFHAYRAHGNEGILRCKDYFLYACYHGVIIEAASDQGFDGLKKMAQECEGTSGRYFQCAHAVGHSILAMWDYDLEESVKTCDKLYEPELERFPGALSSCHNGAFMENLFGVHDWGTGETPSREWISDDPYFPCNAFGEKYQKGCWLNQAARIYQMNNGDIAKVAQLCDESGNEQYVEWCHDNLARQIHPLVHGDIGKVFELCQQVGSFWIEHCIVVNAGSFYSVGDPGTGIAICNQPISPPAKADCYQRIMGQLVPDVNLNPKEKVAFCQKMEGGFQQECLQKINVAGAQSN
jgi:hypothetical protein